MARPGTPAEMRAYIVERLVGDTGEPDRVTAAARSLAERAAPAIAERLNRELAISLAVEVKTVEVVRFAAARPDRPGHAMTVASSAVSPDALVLGIDPAAIGLIVEAMFGADPAAAAKPLARPLSPTEIEVTGLVFNEIAQAVNGSGGSAFAFRLPLPEPSSGPELKKIVLRDGPAARAVFSVTTPGASGEIALTMPQRVLLKHRGQPDEAISGSPAAGEDAWTARFGEEVMRSLVPLEATMPLGAMTLGSLTGLAVGQVLEFPAEAQSRVLLSARDRTLFTCEFGKLGQNYTVRVRQPYDAGQALLDDLMPARQA